ncbi:MAG TPA: HEPN domain-containing protein [Bacteroidales bacterium]|jgi:uncharacterized protein (UPF0332 family)|nr:HEPN domain-containing protein [Bacteroidales bacterium]
MSKPQDTYVKYGFKRAEESFADAQIMIEKHSWNSAINRLYYACFYAVIAFLLKKGLDIRSHDGARIKFSDEFIKTGLIDLNLGRLFNRLSDYRNKGDYADLFDFDQVTVLPLVDQVKDFITEIKNHLEK